jgi:hypothetical protein
MCTLSNFCLCGGVGGEGAFLMTALAMAILWHWPPAVASTYVSNYFPNNQFTWLF